MKTGPIRSAIFCERADDSSVGTKSKLNQDNKLEKELELTCYLIGTTKTSCLQHNVKTTPIKSQ